LQAKIAGIDRNGDVGAVCGVTRVFRKQLSKGRIMHTIVLATQKGGSGKSTLAIGLALAAMQAGHSVRLIETDPQGTISNWKRRRGGAEPLVESVNHTAEIQQRLQAFADSGGELAIVDTAGSVNAMTMAAVRCADLCLIPARPSPADIEAAAPTLSAIRACDKPFAFVLNQTSYRGQRNHHAAATLGEEAAPDVSGVLALPYIVMRNDHQDALGAGLAVTEYAPTGKSAEEIRDLWRWVAQKLKVGAPAHEQPADFHAVGDVAPLMYPAPPAEPRTAR
jgi:chromosome partitioning protein